LRTASKGAEVFICREQLPELKSRVNALASVKLPDVKKVSALKNLD
jgi:hypothetical protein